MSLQIALFGSARYSQVSLGIAFWFMEHFHCRFSRDSVLIRWSKSTVAVRRSVRTCQAYCRCGYRRAAVFDTFKSLSALRWSFSGTFTTDSREIPPLYGLLQPRPQCAALLPLVKLSVAMDIVVRLFSILSSLSRHPFGIFRTLSPPILARFNSYKLY